MNGGFFDDFCLQHFQAQRLDRLVILAHRIVAKQLILRGKKVLLRIVTHLFNLLLYVCIVWMHDIVYMHVHLPKNANKYEYECLILLWWQGLIWTAQLLLNWPFSSFSWVFSMILDSLNFHQLILTIAINISTSNRASWARAFSLPARCIIITIIMQN